MEGKLVFCGTGGSKCGLKLWLGPYILSHNTLQIDFSLLYLNDVSVNKDEIVLFAMIQ